MINHSKPIRSNTLNQNSYLTQLNKNKYKKVKIVNTESGKANRSELCGEERIDFDSLNSPQKKERLQ